MHIKTSTFIRSKFAKKLPEIIEIDTEFAYILGLWKADRCSTAKGIVGLRSKDEILLEAFRNFIKKVGLEVKERIVRGYGVTKEVYCCSMPLRRIFEYVSANRLSLLKKGVIPAYIAGLIDGDGTIVNEKGKKIIKIFYGKRDKKDAETDRKLLEKINIKATLTILKSRNLIVLTIRELSLISKLIFPFLMLKRKRVKIWPSETNDV